MTDTEMKRIPNGAIERNNDMDFASGDITLLNIPDVRDHVVPQLNQGSYDESEDACTIVGALIQIGRLKNIDYKPTDMLKVIAWAVLKKGYVTGFGWYTDRGTNAAVDWFNETQAKNTADYVFYFKGFYTDPKVQEALAKGHYIGFTHDGNAAYNADFKTDLVLDGITFPGEVVYGHRPNVFWKEGLTKDHVNNNYYGAGSNIYRVKDIKGLIKNNWFKTTFYVIMNVSDLQEKPEDIIKKKLMEKAEKTLLFTSSVCHDNCDESVQPAIQSLAADLKLLVQKETAGMPIDKKSAQAVSYLLSYVWNFLEDPETRIVLETTVKYFREKYGVE